MIAKLTACIAALAIMRTSPVVIAHKQFRVPEGMMSRAGWLAWSVSDVSDTYDLDPFLVLALAWHESAFARDRVSIVGAVSIMQLLGHRARTYTRLCNAVRDQWACDYIALDIGAREMAIGAVECGSEAGAVSYYRSGRCGLEKTWRVRQVLALRDELRWGVQ